ncbi:hypothetical protein BKA70DRAFT_1477264 [Coprinopsis sp. MPI-PUGE-AT-0042]|nr:hypothetical protein BKA70DRAFT_1477264 [Coprinopsis sp. MPI-PUGE-AT-0042]
MLQYISLWKERALGLLQRLWAFILSLAIFTSRNPGLPVASPAEKRGSKGGARTNHTVSQRLRLEEEKLGVTNIHIVLPNERSSSLSADQRKERRLAKVPDFNPPPEIAVRDFASQESITHSSPRPDLPRLIVTPSTPSPNRRASVFSDRDPQPTALPEEQTLRPPVTGSPALIGDFVAQVVCSAEDSLEKTPPLASHDTFIFTDSLTEITFGRRRFSATLRSLPNSPKASSSTQFDGVFRDSHGSLVLSDKPHFGIDYPRHASIPYAELFDFDMYRDLRESGASQRLAFGMATRNEHSSCSVSSDSAAGHVHLSVTPPPPYLFIDPALVPARGFDPDVLPNDQSQDPTSQRANASDHFDSSMGEHPSFLTFDRPSNPAVPTAPDSDDIPLRHLLGSGRSLTMQAPILGSDELNHEHLSSVYPPRPDISHARQGSLESHEQEPLDDPSSRSSSPTLPSLDEESHNVFANGIGGASMSGRGVLPGNTRYTLLWSGIQGGTTPPTPTPVRPLRIKGTKSKSEGGLSIRRDVLPLAQGSATPSTPVRLSDGPADLDSHPPATTSSPYWNPIAPFSASHTPKGTPLRVTNGTPGSVSSSEEKRSEKDMDSVSVDEQESSFTASYSASSSIVDLQSAIFHSAVTRGRSRTRSAMGLRHTLPSIVEEAVLSGGVLNEGQSSDYFLTHRRSTSSGATIRGRTAVLLTHLNLQAERRRAGIYSNSTVNTKEDMTIRLHSLDVEEDMQRPGLGSSVLGM